jgi:hypothetical protein
MEGLVADIACSNSNDRHESILKDTARTKTRLHTMRSYFLTEETEALLIDALVCPILA